MRYSIDPTEYDIASLTGPIPMRAKIEDGKMTWKQVYIHKEIDISQNEFKWHQYTCYREEE